MKIKVVILAGLLLAISLFGACSSQPQSTIPSSPDATKPSLGPGETILLSSAVSLGEVTPQPYAKELDIKQVETFEQENDFPGEILNYGWYTDGYAVGYKQAYRYDPDNPDQVLRDGSMLELFFYERDAQGNWVERGSVQHEDYADYGGFTHSEKYLAVRLYYNAEGNQEGYMCLKAVALDSGEETEVVRVQQTGNGSSGIYDPKMIDERLYYRARTRASDDPNDLLYNACWDEIYSVDMATMEKTRIYQSKNPSLNWSMMMTYNVDNREIYLTETDKNQLYMQHIDLTDGSVSERVFEAGEKDSISVEQMSRFDRFIYFMVTNGSDNNLYLFDPDRLDLYTIPNGNIFQQYPVLVGNHLYLQTFKDKTLTICRYDLAREQQPAAVILDMSTTGVDNPFCERFQESEGKLKFNLTQYSDRDLSFYEVSIEF